MLEERDIKIPSKHDSSIHLRVVAGHFATNHSHINYYMDMTSLKSRQTEAALVAKVMAKSYKHQTIIDTIVCMDGCEVIGTHLAQELTAAGIMSINSHKSLYIVTPELNTYGQLIFRDNILPMIHEKNILLLLASATTGKTVAKSIECIDYYGGHIHGISAIFSEVSHIQEYHINSIFTTEDLPDYHSYSHENCQLCNEKVPIEAIVNGYGYSLL